MVVEEFCGGLVKKIEGVPFTLQYQGGKDDMKTDDDIKSWVTKYQNQIEELLKMNGQILFRGFPFSNSSSNSSMPEAFDKFVCGFVGWEDLPYEESYSFAVRNRISNRICTTNEGRTGGLVFHHEQAQTPKYPSKLFFCCEQPANLGEGGETGICDSYILLQKIQEKYPDFYEKCEKLGVQYTMYASSENDSSKGAGRSWKSFFHVNNKDECEQIMKEGGWEWEWGIGPDGNSMDKDFLKVTTPILDVIKTCPGTSKKCFFNQLIATTANAMEFMKVGVDGTYDDKIDKPNQNAIDACVKFADNSSINVNILLELRNICEELAVDVTWEKGDVLLLDNYLYMHARRIWSGELGTRRVLASLVK